MNWSFRPIVMLLFLALQAHGTSLICRYYETEKFSTGCPRLESDTIRVNIRSRDSSNFFFYPFGMFTDFASARKAVTRDFPGWNFAPEKAKPDYYLATVKTDSLEFAFTDRFEIRRFEIVYAKINSTRPKLREGIRIGMGKELFFGVFFREYPARELRICRVFETCTGPCEPLKQPAPGEVRHYYGFKDGKLSKIEIHRT